MVAGSASVDVRRSSQENGKRRRSGQLQLQRLHHRFRIRKARVRGSKWVARQLERSKMLDHPAWCPKCGQGKLVRQSEMRGKGTYCWLKCTVRSRRHRLSALRHLPLHGWHRASCLPSHLMGTWLKLDLQGGAQIGLMECGVYSACRLGVFSSFLSSRQLCLSRLE